MRYLLIGTVLLFSACGSQGPTGPKGDAGAVGPAGPSGVSIVAIKQCSRVDTTVHTVMTYQLELYSNNAISAVCSVSTADGQYSGFTYATTANGSCLVTADVSNAASGGYWEFTTVGAVSKAVYTDSGDPANGYTSTFLSSECVVTTL